jgi:uncharacterized small protein (DUF1192 family)
MERILESLLSRLNIPRANSVSSESLAQAGLRIDDLLAENEFLTFLVGDLKTQLAERTRHKDAEIERMDADLRRKDADLQRMDADLQRKDAELIQLKEETEYTVRRKDFQIHQLSQKVASLHQQTFLGGVTSSPSTVVAIPPSGNSIGTH